MLDRFGCLLLLDCHSMPPPPDGVPPVVFGDCRDRAAASWLSSEAVAISAALASTLGSTIHSRADILSTPCKAQVRRSRATDRFDRRRYLIGR